MAAGTIDCRSPSASVVSSPSSPNPISLVAMASHPACSHYWCAESMSSCQRRDGLDLLWPANPGQRHARASRRLLAGAGDDLPSGDHVGQHVMVTSLPSFRHCICLLDRSSRHQSSPAASPPTTRSTDLRVVPGLHHLVLLSECRNNHHLWPVVCGRKSSEAWMDAKARSL